TNPSAVGTNPSAVGTNPSAVGTNPSAVGTNPSVVDTYPSVVDTSKFDLTLNALDTGEGLNFQVEYCVKLFKEETIKRFITYFKGILQTVFKAPEQKIAEIEIITEEEKRKILYEFNDTAADYPANKTIHQLFEEQVEKTPDNIGLVGSPQLAVGKEKIKDNKEIIEDKENTVKEKTSSIEYPVSSIQFIQLTYQELNERANRLAHHLQSKGAGPGTIVAIKTQRSVEMIIGLLGILKTGSAYLPIDPHLPEERIKYILKDSNAKVLLKEMLQELNELKELDDGIEIIDINTIYQFFSLPPQLSGIRQTSGHLPTGIAYIIYTSGTTGKAKGVMVEHRSIVNTLTWRKNYYKFSVKEIVLQMASYSFDSSAEDIFTPLISGARLISVPGAKRTDLEYLKTTISRGAVSHILLVPRLYQTLLIEIPESLTGLDFI
ncbi:MAG: AMP-binding protein, partial [bacterium]|nr:AMP-binding protein [bacterium]